MKLFLQKGFHLSQLALPARLVYSLFLVFIGVGLWTSAVIYRDRIGGDLRGPPGKPSVEDRYVNRAPAAPPAAAAGPAMDLGPEDAVPPSPGAVTPAEDLKAPWVMDVFHQHLFTIAVVFLILAHLFMLTRLHYAVAAAVILVAGLGALLHVLAPVLIWASDGGWLWLMPVSGAAMGVSWTAMVLWSLGAMWLVRPTRLADTGIRGEP